MKKLFIILIGVLMSSTIANGKSLQEYSLEAYPYTAIKDMGILITADSSKNVAIVPYEGSPTSESFLLLSATMAPFRVLTMTESGDYLISSNYNPLTSEGTQLYNNKFIITPQAAQKAELKYISFETLLPQLSADLSLVNNIVGKPIHVYPQRTHGDGVKVFTQDDGTIVTMPTAFYSTSFYMNVLRMNPADDASFITNIVPQQVVGALNNPKKITVDDEKDGWLKLTIHYYVIYNSSKNPDGCARSLFNRTTEGWWKAPYDENGYPLLLLEITNWNTL